MIEVVRGLNGRHGTAKDFRPLRPSNRLLLQAHHAWLELGGAGRQEDPG
jgi:hypothetical protein